MTISRKVRWRVAIAFAVYVAAYVVLSRMGIAEAVRYHDIGFRYVPAELPDEWADWGDHLNVWLGVIFYPIHVIDVRLFGTMHHAPAAPLRRLS